MARFDNFRYALSLDPVILSIIEGTAKAEKREVGYVVELMVYQLWLQQSSLSNDGQSSISSTLAAQLASTNISDTNVPGQTIPNAAGQIQKRKADLAEVGEQIRALLTHNEKLRNRVSNCLRSLITMHGKFVPHGYRTIQHLVISFYVLECKAMPANEPDTKHHPMLSSLLHRAHYEEARQPSTSEKEKKNKNKEKHDRSPGVQKARAEERKAHKTELKRERREILIKESQESVVQQEQLQQALPAAMHLILLPLRGKLGGELVGGEKGSLR